MLPFLILISVRRIKNTYLKINAYFKSGKISSSTAKCQKSSANLSHKYIPYFREYSEPEWGNYSSFHYILAKIRVFKVDYFILPLFFVPKLKSVAKNRWKKHSYIFFLLLVQKKQVWAEKIRKKQKNSKNLKVAGNYPNI
jgi:hypothetical protein